MNIPGWDLFHFLFQSHSDLRDWCRPVSAMRGTTVWRYFKALQIDFDLIPWLLAAYLASLWMLLRRMWNASENQGSAEVLSLLRRNSNLLFILLEIWKGR